MERREEGRGRRGVWGGDWWLVEKDGLGSEE